MAEHPRVQSPVPNQPTSQPLSESSGWTLPAGKEAWGALRLSVPRQAPVTCWACGLRSPAGRGGLPAAPWRVLRSEGCAAAQRALRAARGFAQATAVSRLLKAVVTWDQVCVTRTPLLCCRRGLSECGSPRLRIWRLLACGGGTGASASRIPDFQVSRLCGQPWGSWESKDAAHLAAPPALRVLGTCGQTAVCTVCVAGRGAWSCRGSRLTSAWLFVAGFESLVRGTVICGKENGPCV